jgi:hypothetical protein
MSTPAGKITFSQEAFDEVQRFKNGMVKLILSKLISFIRAKTPNEIGDIVVSIEDIQKAIDMALKDEAALKEMEDKKEVATR